MSEKSLYERLGGYDGITAFCSDLLARLAECDDVAAFVLVLKDDIVGV